MRGPEAKQGKPVRTDSCFLTATLSACTYMVIEDLCIVISVVSQAPSSLCPCSLADVLTLGQQQLAVLHYQVQ